MIELHFTESFSLIGVSIMPSAHHHKHQMLDNAFANGTSASVVDLTCNTSQHIANTGISASTKSSSNGGSGSSTLPLSGCSSSRNTSPVQNISTSALSGTTSSTGITVNTSASLTRTSEATSGTAEPTSAGTIEQEST